MKQLLKFTLSFLLFITCLPSTFAQQLDHVLGDVLIQPEKGIEINQLVSELQQFQDTYLPIEIVGIVSKPLNIWRLHFDHNQINERRFLSHILKHPKVNVAQFNHLVSMRETTPDDPLFDNQWQYVNIGLSGGVADADIDADLAWDIATGGITAQGDTIVVAVLDNGMDLNHTDFGNNLWVNYAEIPDNGIDDDGNGYIDDYRGWSIISDSDDVTHGGNNGHGTAVAGIIGAKGNNNIGVAGINWDVKVMVIKNNFNANEAEVLEAYTYPLQARIKYNETNGTEGAFVVATNASWGVNGGDPASAPLWCAFYDTLGEAGILNCGATANIDINVDTDGDLPTACTSDFLVSVTNTTRSDFKVPGAGYGAISIDLGAPGQDSYTTTNNNTYDAFAGTSAATPHVTGAIALLYATTCENFIGFLVAIDLGRTSPKTKS